MANATKAQLAAQVAELQQQLAQADEAATETLIAASRRIEELEAALALRQGAAEQAAVTPHLDQVLWLQRKPLVQRTPDGRGNVGYTRTGVLTVRFGAQYASLDKRTGTRTFGAWKFFTAYGETAKAVMAFMASEDRLARVQAYEEPWSSASDPNARQSDWVVRGFEPIGRGATQAQPVAAPAPVRPAAAPVPAWNQEPTLDQIPY